MYSPFEHLSSKRSWIFVKVWVGDSVLQVYMGRFPQILVNLKRSLRLIVGMDLNKSTVHIGL